MARREGNDPNPASPKPQPAQPRPQPEPSRPDPTKIQWRTRHPPSARGGSAAQCRYLAYTRGSKRLPQPVARSI
jgi:hypothetical protein